MVNCKTWVIPVTPLAVINGHHTLAIELRGVSIGSIWATIDGLTTCILHTRASIMFCNPRQRKWIYLVQILCAVHVYVSHLAGVHEKGCRNPIL